MTLVGVIADTHGRLRPKAVAALKGCALILHAGDVGKREVLDGLRAIAPVVAVRGNVDLGWTRDLPEAAEVVVAGRCFVILHDRAELAVDPVASGIDVVVSGHSHRALIETREGVLYVNPGSAGPRRFRLPITLARIEVTASTVEARIVELSG